MEVSEDEGGESFAWAWAWDMQKYHVVGSSASKEKRIKVE